MRALIVDEPADRSALAAARAFGADGWTVGTASWTPGLSARSRASSAWHAVPHPNEGIDPFVAGVADVCAEHAYDVVFPSWDAAVLILSERREELAATFPYAPHPVVARAFDKAALTEAAEGVGLAVPRTLELFDDASLDGWAGPLVIKPVSHAPAFFTARPFDAPGPEALAHARAIREAGGRPIAQERVVGRLDGFAGVVGRDGRLLTAVQQRGELSWPLDAGDLVRGVTVAVDPELRAGVEALMRELGWFGLAHLDFITPADGRPRLLDLNGRFYGTLALSLGAGINHPGAWGRAAMGAPPAPAEAAAGARFQWFTRDLRAASASPDRVRQVARTLRLAPVSSHSLLSKQEPSVALRFFAEQARRAVRRRLGRPAW